MSDIASARLRLGAEQKQQVAVLFVTTDPARDTPSVMRKYLDRFDPRRRGAHRAVRRSSTGRGAWASPIEKGQKLTSGGYTVEHGGQIVGVLPDGTAPFVWRHGASSAQLADDLASPERTGASEETPRERLILPRSPARAARVWYLGPIPIRAYALCIIAGVLVAVWLGERRWVARGGKPGQIGDIAIWAVPFGIVGGRLYHVITDNGLYFGAGEHPWRALYIWQGGLGIWGAVALGALGAWIGARRQGIKFPPLADALAPGWSWPRRSAAGATTSTRSSSAGRPRCPGGWRSTSPTGPPGYRAVPDLPADLPLRVDLGRRGRRPRDLAGPEVRIGHGRVFALYVACYSLGRAWIEYLRIDPVAGRDVFGLRLNVWTSLVVASARGLLPVSRRARPGREEAVPRGAEPTAPATPRGRGRSRAGTPGDSVTPDPAQSPGEDTRSLD